MMTCLVRSTALALVVTTGAHADYSHVRVDRIEGVLSGTVTHRLFVVFGDPTDAVLAISSIPNHAPLRLVTSAPLVQDPGAAAGLAGEDEPAPDAGAGDTWVTIGGDPGAGLSEVGFTPGFGDPAFPGASVIRGTLVEEWNGSWYDTDPATPENGGSVLIGQFTLPAGATATLQALLAARDGGTPGSLMTAPLLLHFGDRDCDGDGMIDADQIAAGAADDANRDLVPDTCQCIADGDDDGVVGFEDLALVLADWGPCDFCAGDVDRNGRIDLGDLLFVLSAWGSCAD